MEHLTKDFYRHSPVMQRLILKDRYRALTTCKALALMHTDINKIYERERADASPETLPHYKRALSTVRKFAANL